MGACISGAKYLSRCLAEHGEDAPLLEIGADLFEEQCSALDAFAAEWVAALADAAFGAFSVAAVHYTGGMHLLTFGRDDVAENAENAGAGDGSGGDVGDARGLGAEASASSLLAAPLAVLRERLAGLRAALYDPSDQSAYNSAIRQLAGAIALHVVNEVAVSASFTTSGGDPVQSRITR